MTQPTGKALDNRRIVILIGSVIMLFISAGGGMYLMIVSLKQVAATFGWPREVPSLAFSLQFVGSGFGGILMGHVLDRYGYGVPALVGTLMVGFGAILTSFIQAQWQLYAIYLIMFGLAGQGSLAAPALANMARWFTRRRGMAIGIAASGQALAGVVWPPIYSRVLEVTDWRTMYLWFGFCALAVLLPICWVVRHKPPPLEPSAVPAQGAPRAARPRPPLQPRSIQTILCVAIVGCCTAMALPLGHLVAYATDLGHPLTVAAQVMSVTLLCAFVSRLIFVGLFSDNLGGLLALIIFSSVQGATLAGLIPLESAPALFLMGALFGLGYGGVFPVYAVVTREYLPPAEVGRRTGIIFLFGAAAMGFGGWMGGALFDITGSYALPFAIGAGFNLANVVILAVLFVRLRGQGAAAQAPA